MLTLNVNEFNVGGVESPMYRVAIVASVSSTAITELPAVSCIAVDGKEM